MSVTASSCHAEAELVATRSDKQSLLPSLEERLRYCTAEGSADAEAAAVQQYVQREPDESAATRTKECARRLCRPFSNQKWKV